MTTVQHTRTDLPTRAHYGAAVRAALDEAHVTQCRAAAELGLSRATIGRIVAGRSPLYVGVIFALAKMTGRNSWDLVESALSARRPARRRR